MESQNQSHFCPHSGIWVGSRPTEAASLGAGLLKNKASLKSFEALTLWLPIWLSPLLLLYVVAKLFLSTDFPQSIDASVSFLSLFVLIFFAIPLSFIFGLSSGKTLLSKLFKLDTWIGFYLVSALFEFAYELVKQPESSQYFLSSLPGQLSILVIIYSIYVLVRYLEAKQLQKLMPTANEMQNERINAEFIAAEKKEIIIRFLGLGFLFLLAFELQFLFKKNISVSEFFLVSLPIVSPFIIWSRSMIVHKLNSYGTQIPSFELLSKIAKIKHLTCHHFGIFSRSKLNVDSEWTDPSALISANEIKSLLAGICKNSRHPLSQAIWNAYSDFDQIEIDPADIVEVPNIGLDFKKRDEMGNLIHYEVKSWSWVKFARHQYTKEFSEIVQSFVSLDKKVVCFSINQRLVACIGAPIDYLNDNEIAHFSKELEAHQIRLNLLSSDSSRIPLSHEKLSQQTQTELTPIEREVSHQKTLERVPLSAEVISDWDKAFSRYQLWIAFCRDSRQPLDVDLNQTVLVRQMPEAPALISLTRLIQIARTWERRRYNLTSLVHLMAIALIFVFPYELKALVSLLAVFASFQLSMVRVK